MVVVVERGWWWWWWCVCGGGGFDVDVDSWRMDLGTEMSQHLIQ